MAKKNSLELSIKIAGKLDKSLEKSVNLASKQFSSFSKGISSIARGIGIATVATVAATATISAACLKQAADLEESMSQVRTLLTGTAEETATRTAELTKDVLSISLATGQASTEISEGMYQVVSAFGQAADIAGITSIATKSSIAGQAEMVDTVNALAAVTKAYNDTSLEAVQRVSDLSFETIRLGQTTMPELASGIQKASGSAAALNVSQEELYAGFATLTGVIGNTETVGTALNTMYTKMLKPSKALTAAVNALGYESAYAMVQTNGIGESIRLLGEYAGGDATKFASLFSMRDLKAAQGILNTMDVYMDKLDQLKNAEGATDRAFYTSIDNFNSISDIIKNAGSVFMQEIGMRMLPYAKQFAKDVLPQIQEGIEKALDKIDEWAPKLQEGFGYLVDNGPQVIGVITAITAAWAGMRFAPQIESMVGGATSLFSGIFTGVSKATQGKGFLGTVSKIGFGNILKGAADYGSYGLDLFNATGNAGTMMDILKQKASGDKNLQALMKAFSKTGAGKVAGYLGGIVSAKSPLGAVGAAISPLLSGFGSLLAMFGPAILGIGSIVALVSILGDHFEDVRTLVGNIFGEKGLTLFDGFTSGIQSVFDKVTGFFTPEGLAGVQQLITNVFGEGAGNAFGTLIPVIESVTSVIGQIVDLGVNHLKPLFEEIFRFAVEELFPAIMPLLSTVIGLVGTTLINAIKLGVDLVKGALPIIEPVILGIIGFVQSLATAAVSVVNWIIRALNKIQVTVPDWVPNFGGKSFGFNLTEVPVPQFAKGGFTNGPSIAGESGTEAVISFQRGVRDQNIDLWRTAGRMLGVEDDSDNGTGAQFIFSPQITIQGDADEEQIRQLTEELYEKFVEMIERYFREKGRKSYAM